MTSLYKGLTSPLLGVALTNAFLFGIYSHTLELLNKNISATKCHLHQTCQCHSSLYNVFIAGCISGFFNSFISCPTELIKIQLQNERKISTTKIAQKKFGPSKIAINIYKNFGMKGLYFGMVITLLRETPSYGFYFITYEYLLRTLHQSYESQYFKDIKLMFAGGIAGALGWLSTYPFDVIKTRIQSQRFISTLEYEQRCYQTIIQTFKLILKEEGFKALYRGMNATILRAFPTNAFLFLAYSYTLNALHEPEEYPENFPI